MTTTAPDARDVRPGYHGDLVLAAMYFFRQRDAVPRLLRDGVRTNDAELTRQG